LQLSLRASRRVTLGYRVKGEQAVVGATQPSITKVKLNLGVDSGSGNAFGGIMERPLNAATVRLCYGFDPVTPTSYHDFDP
jgi:hypothetical protein